MNGQINFFLGQVLFMTGQNIRSDEWSLRAFASMPSTEIFLRARAEIKNLLCELASNCKNLGSTSERALVSILRANRAKVKFCEQLKILMDHSSPLILGGKATFPNNV